MVDSVKEDESFFGVKDATQQELEGEDRAGGQECSLRNVSSKWSIKWRKYIFFLVNKVKED